MSKNYSVQEWLKKYYHFILMHTKIGKPAKEYLLQRGIYKETMRTFRLGFAPHDVKPTLGFLKGKGFSFNELVEQKILKRYTSGELKGRLTDPFKGRIIFPICDFQGKTIGFGGRTMDKENKVKYINSPETDVFVKGDNVYGFDLAKEEIKKQGYAILFEGYFDTITAYQAGIKNSVSTLGTALTVNQALLLKNITNNVVITFDGDKAGMESSFKSASVLNKVGCKVRISHIPNEHDPDEFIKKFGGQTFVKEVILTAKPMLESYIKYKKKDYNLSSPNDRYAYASEILSVTKTNNIKETKAVLKSLGTALNVPLKEIYKMIGEGG